jgi:uncharacterized protein
MDDRVVIDTNVFVSALIRADTAPRSVLRLCLQRAITPLMSTALYMEYVAVNNRDHLFNRSPLDKNERNNLLDDVMSVCDWVSIYYSWRPNLKDEGDNHVMELAVAGGASGIITGNTKDFAGDLLFPEVQILTPKTFLDHFKKRMH